MRKARWSAIGPAALAALFLAAASTSPWKHALAADVALRFRTLGPHASLPSGNWCASRVAATPETMPINVPFNRTKPTLSELARFYQHPIWSGPPASDFFRVDGNYTGSTDMILRWAACKWGIDEDVVRAQAWNENKWKQGSIHEPAVGGGDRRMSINDCVQGDFSALWNYACPGCCYQSWGILQTKVFYEWGTWPMIKDSTAFNADYRYAVQRACMNGDYNDYFASAEQQPNTYASDIASGDVDRILWGCIGMHFSGGWYDNHAIHYIAEVKNHVATRPWERKST
jgi:hypothetical protein